MAFLWYQDGMYFVILETILCILLWIGGQNLSSEIRVRGKKHSSGGAVLEFRPNGGPAFILQCTERQENWKLPSILWSFYDSYELSCSIERASLAATKKQTHTTTRELYIQQLYHFLQLWRPCVLSQHRLARWNNDGAETYGGLARLALIHHICLRPAAMTASKVEDGLVCVGWQSWTVGFGIDQSTPTWLSVKQAQKLGWSRRALFISFYFFGQEKHTVVFWNLLDAFGLASNPCLWGAGLWELGSWCELDSEHSPPKILGAGHNSSNEFGMSCPLTSINPTSQCSWCTGEA